MSSTIRLWITLLLVMGITVNGVAGDGVADSGVTKDWSTDNGRRGRCAAQYAMREMI